MTNDPTDAELDMLIDDVAGLDSSNEVFRKFARAVLAKWGTPAPVEVEPLALLVRKNSWREGQWEAAPPNSPSYGLVWANQRVYVYTTPQPTQAQAGAVPLTPIRKAALDLYTPPFRHEYGYIRDANNQIVSDDASSVATGLIAARIRGWGRIQYMDKPEMRANALQDEVAEIVAEALNVYWAAHGITQKGGSNAE